MLSCFYDCETVLMWHFYTFIFHFLFYYQEEHQSVIIQINEYYYHSLVYMHITTS